jgi:opacity protein-like surface antigen
LLKACVLIILLFLTLTGDCFANNFLVVMYPVKAGDSLKQIVLKFMKEGVPQSAANDSLIVTMKKNPQIKKWNPFLSDAVFKLYLDPKIVDLKAYNKYYTEINEQYVHHFALFTTPSIGFFSQSDSGGYTLKYNQISYINLGGTYLYTPYQKMFHMSMSFYYSTISSTTNQTNSDSSSTVNIPSEYGANVYALYNSDSRFTFYGGIDYEKFSIFNLQQLQADNVVSVDDMNVFYATLGMKYTAKFNEKLNFKSLTSTVSSSNSTKVSLSGIKVLVGMNYNFNEKWSLNSFLKNHNFDGDNTLTITRFGVGASYNFF